MPAKTGSKAKSAPKAAAKGAAKGKARETVAIAAAVAEAETIDGATRVEAGLDVAAAAAGAAAVGRDTVTQGAADLTHGADEVLVAGRVAALADVVAAAGINDVEQGAQLLATSEDIAILGAVVGAISEDDLDRGLQMGTGTTDLLFGVYKNGSLGEDWGYFSQAMGQVALKGRDGFRPGNAMNANAGVRYTGNPVVAPHVQMNFRMEARETGENADTPNSGATLAYLSPGVTIQAGARVQFYGFVQVPVLQRVNGLQVEPRSIFSAGVHCTF